MNKALQRGGSLPKGKKVKVIQSSKNCFEDIRGSAMKLSNQEVKSYDFSSLGEKPRLTVKTVDNCTVIYKGKQAEKMLAELEKQN